MTRRESPSQNDRDKSQKARVKQKERVDDLRETLLHTCNG
jgi:hypothetical protein